MENVLEVFTDGGARGNPGPASCAFVINSRGKKIVTGSKFLGSTTNNVAEYNGVILALNWINENIKTYESYKINFFLDSELVVKQLNGFYKVKHETLRSLFSEVRQLIGGMKNDISFTHIPRAKNKHADKLVNVETDNNIL